MADAPTYTLVADFGAADDFAKKHTPFIAFERQHDTAVVTVEVGREVPHPNGTDHYITWIELYVEDSMIARVDLSPAVTGPRVTVPVSLPAGTTIRAVGHCNLHGLWAYEARI
jgi:superoxide reductase